MAYWRIYQLKLISIISSVVNFSANQYFALIVPLCALLQGSVLIGCWAAMRPHRYLLWIAASYIISSVPLAAQSLMETSQLATWSVATSAFYLVGIWCGAKGMADKSGVSAYPRLALCLIAVTLSLLFYFSIINDQLWKRMIILNTALSILIALPLKGVWHKASSPQFIERLLRISFVILVAYAFFRTGTISIFMTPEITGQFTQSGYWLLMLACSMLISLWFTFVLLACAAKDTFMILQHERNQDPLTRLLNRRAFFELAEFNIKSVYKEPWAVIMCDIDHFKKINDTWGHAAGDQVLKMVGESLLSQSRKEDLVARFGGEEFVILMTCHDVTMVSTVAQRMRLEISQLVLPNIPVTLTASFGVAMAEDGMLLEDTLAQADDFLYQAKHAGRNQVCFKTEDDRQERTDLVSIETAVF